MFAPVVSVHEIAVVEKLVVEKGVRDKHLGHGYQDVEQLAEEEAEGVLVELVVHVLLKVEEQPSLLVVGIFDNSTCKVSHSETFSL